MPNRQLIDQATRHAVHLERLKSGDVAQFDRFLRRMERYVVGQIAAENVTDWTLKRLNQQLAAIRGYLSEQYHGPVHDLWREQIMDLAQYEAGFEIRSMSQVIQYDFTLPSSQQLTSAVFSRPLSVRGADGGKLLETFYDTWTDAQIGRVDGMIRMGYAQGQTTPQIVRNLRDFGGVFEQNRRGFEMMTRTALQHAANEARQATWERNSDIITGVRWVSTLDDRTTAQCAALDGQVFPADKGPRPPAHVGCRSTVVPELDRRFRALDEGGTRAARDPETGDIERVPARQTYYGWLKDQPADVQDSIIGPARGKLLRDGGLSAQRFADMQLGRRFEPLTLDQMRQLEPLAFKRAGL